MLRPTSILAFAASLPLFLVACNDVAGLTAAGNDAGHASTANVTLKYAVEGMHCDGCVQAITAKVTKVKGVVSCEVLLDAKTATIVVSDESVRAGVEEAITKLGYKIEKKS